MYRKYLTPQHDIRIYVTIMDIRINLWFSHQFMKYNMHIFKCMYIDIFLPAHLCTTFFAFSKSN